MGQKNSEVKDNDRRNGFLKKLIAALAVAIVVTCTVFYVIFYRFSYQADKLSKETARIYAFGSGEEMAEYIAPGYVEKFESGSKVLAVKDVQGIYIDKFRTYTQKKVGDTTQIECKIKGIQAVSNVKELQPEFEKNGLKNVTQYRSVEAEWIVTGEDGREVTVPVNEFVLKCEDGWYVDYVVMPDEINSIGSPEESSENN